MSYFKYSYNLMVLKVSHNTSTHVPARLLTLQQSRTMSPPQLQLTTGLIELNPRNMLTCYTGDDTMRFFIGNFALTLT